MGHIAHLRKSSNHCLNTFAQSFDYTIPLIKKINHYLFFWELNDPLYMLSPLHSKILYAKFGWKRSNGSGEEDF